MSKNDITQFGLTQRAKKAREIIHGDLGWFNKAHDLLKFAISVHLNTNGKELAPIKGKKENAYTCNSFDDDGKILELIYLYHPKTDTPYKIMENWINSGLEEMIKKVDNDEEFILTNYFKR